MSQRIKFIQGGDAKTSRHSIDIPIGVYNALLWVVYGTTDASQTLADDDIGRYRFERDGRQLQSEDFEFLHEYTNMKAGSPTATLPTAGATRIVALIPFQAPGMPNALDVRNKEECDLHFEFDSTTLSTRFGSNAATFEVYGIMTPFQAERYELEINEQDVSVVSGRVDDVLNGKNTGMVYLKDGSSVVNKLTVQIDGSVAIDNIDDDTLLDVTHLFNRYEGTVSEALIELNFAPLGTIAETQNRNVELTVDGSGSGTLELTKFQIMPSGRAEASRAAVRRRFQDVANGAPRSRPARAVS